MPQPLGEMKPGENFPYSARFWNPVVGAARDYRNSQNPQPGSNPSNVAAARAIIVWVKNTTGATVGRNCPLKISGVAVTPTANEAGFRDGPIFNGVAPDGDAVEKLVLTIEPIRDGKIGQAVVSGAAIATIDVTDLAHEFARPINTDVTKLTSSADGLPILYVATSLGQSVGCVLLGGASSGGGSNWVEGYATAAFDTATTTITITVATVIRGDSALAGTNVSMTNPLPFSGASERTYAGVANCYIQAMQADDDTWRLIEIAPTICLCDDTNNPGSGTP